MSLNTYCNPKILIEDVGVIEAVNGTISIPGKSQLSSLKVTFHGDWIQGASLMHKEVKFYLNNGSEDTVPFFIGYIKQVTPTKDAVSIVVFDARCFITGEFAEKITIDDDFNYDGYTLGGFIISFIDKYININKTLIDTSALRDTDPPIPMFGYRAKNRTPYQILLALIKEAVEEQDLFNAFDHEIGVNFSSTGTNLLFIKQKKLDKPCISFSHNDGIKDVSYKKFQIPNRGKLDEFSVDFGGFNKQQRYTKDIKNKVVWKNIAGKFDSPALVRETALKALIRAREELYTIDLKANKGHYLQLGQTIHLNIDSEIKGTHRITSKNVTFGPNGSSVSFKLNSRPIEIDDY